MGIQGLLPQLKSIMTPIGVEELRGQTVAVDTYSWLHKGALSCSTQLCKGLPTSRHIDYCMHRVNLLRHHGVKPILVFDGGFLPMKSEQETKRARSRKENLERALEHEATGNYAAAFESYQKAVDISPSIAWELIQVLKKEKVDYIVAPYEADAQMTFLSINNHVDAVITEDSDLIPFGCFRIIFKMDKFGQGVEYKSSMLGKNKELDFSGFTKTMLLEMCIFSGCDYLQSLPGMGLKRAHALVQKFKSYERVIKHLRYSAVPIPPLYEETFKKAIWAFQYQRVYDPSKEDIVHLSDIPHDLGLDLEFLGPWLPQSMAVGIAKGDIDPLKKMPFQGKETPNIVIANKIYTEKEVAPPGGRKKLDLPVQRNVLTNYFCLASLEAKRKFIAPKVMPNRARMLQSSPSTDDHVPSLPDSAEDTGDATNSQASMLSSENFSDPLLEDSMDNKSSSGNNKLMGLSPYGNCNNSMLLHSLAETGKKTLEPVLGSDKENSGKTIVDSGSSNMISAGKKVILKSRYFQKRSMDENVLSNQNEDPLTDKESAHDILYGHSMSKGASVQVNYQNGLFKKRKVLDAHNGHQGVFQPKNECTNVSPSNEDSSSSLTNKDANSEEGIFGCNISHLKNYSGIAEKSMERFISLIDSFRYTSSGSRASGLRPPLKDVRNTCSRRSTVRARQHN